MQGKPVPTRWNGHDYPSLSQAARENFISLTGLVARLDKGYTCDTDLRQATQARWNGQVYAKITLAAKAVNVSESQMRKWLKAGYTCDDDVS